MKKKKKNVERAFSERLKVGLRLLRNSGFPLRAPECNRILFEGRQSLLDEPVGLSDAIVALSTSSGIPMRAGRTLACRIRTETAKICRMADEYYDSRGFNDHASPVGKEELCN